MKKAFLSILALMMLATVHAQQTVVIERPGIFSDLASAATALVTLPAAAVSGIVVGTVEGVKDVITGSAIVVAPPAPVVVQPRVVTPAPVVVPNNQVVVTSPIVVGAPTTTVTTTVGSPVRVPGGTFIPTPTTRITTDYGNGTTVTVIREASGYELGGGIVYPVDPAHRVGSSPFVNPYIYRPHGR